MMACFFSSRWWWQERSVSRGENTVEVPLYATMTFEDQVRSAGTPPGVRVSVALWIGKSSPRFLRFQFRMTPPARGPQQSPGTDRTTSRRYTAYAAALLEDSMASHSRVIHRRCSRMQLYLLRRTACASWWILCPPDIGSEELQRSAVPPANRFRIAHV